MDDEAKELEVTMRVGAVAPDMLPTEMPVQVPQHLYGVFDHVQRREDGKYAWGDDNFNDLGRQIVRDGEI